MGYQDEFLEKIVKVQVTAEEARTELGGGVKINELMDALKSKLIEISKESDEKKREEELKKFIGDFKINGQGQVIKGLENLGENLLELVKDDKNPSNLDEQKFAHEKDLRDLFLSLSFGNYQEVVKKFGNDLQQGVSHQFLSQYYQDPKLLAALYTSLFTSLSGEKPEDFIQLLNNNVQIYKENGDADVRATRYYKNEFLKNYIKAKKVANQYIELTPIFDHILQNHLCLKEAKDILAVFFEGKQPNQEEKEQIRNFFVNNLRQELQDIHWYNGGSEDLQMEKPWSAEVTKVFRVGSYQSYKIPGHHEYDGSKKHKLTGELLISKKQFSDLEKKLTTGGSNGFEEIFSGLETSYSKIYQEQLRTKVLYLAFLAMDEEYRYVVGLLGDGDDKPSGNQFSYGQDHTLTILQDVEDENGVVRKG
ncbi:MAG: hypothetical protein O3B09_04575, partial [Proteobacteria bacterium]|nr:hypothetical protein [Pseudomonadota bacterium]